MSNTATLDQACHLLTMFKQLGVTKQQFELMQPYLADLCKADPTLIDRNELRKVLGLSLNSKGAAITVDYSLSLEQMIAKMKSGYVDPDINSKRFPLKQKAEQIILEPKVFHFNKYIHSINVLKEMDKVGYRPATLEELIAYSATFPEEQMKHYIVALGTIVRIRLVRHVPVIYRHNETTQRGLFLDSYSDTFHTVGHPPHERFLAFPK